MRPILLFLAFPLFLSCTSSPKDTAKSQNQLFVETVSGKINPNKIGLALIHEHVLVDFIGADLTDQSRWDREEVVERVLPYLLEAKSKGVQTIFECTPAYLGRDPLLLRQLSEASGINIITNTGYYGAVGGKYLPQSAHQLSAEQLAQVWSGEYFDGIEGTGIRPGFIKISVNDTVPLVAVDAKLVRAAAIASKRTGLVVVSHTGPWAVAEAQIRILQQENVDLQKFVWVHAQKEQDFNNYLKASALGVWISLDGVAWDVAGHAERLIFAREKGILKNVLISHDAGWYRPGEPNGGDFRGYNAIFDELIPELLDNGWSEEEIRLLMLENPRKAFGMDQ